MSPRYGSARRLMRLCINSLSAVTKPAEQSKFRYGVAISLKPVSRGLANAQSTSSLLSHMSSSAYLFAACMRTPINRTSERFDMHCPS